MPTCPSRLPAAELEATTSEQAGSKEQGAGSREQGAGRRAQGAGSREQGEEEGSWPGFEPFFTSTLAAHESKLLEGACALSAPAACELDLCQPVPQEQGMQSAQATEGKGQEYRRQQQKRSRSELHACLFTGWRDAMPADGRQVALEKHAVVERRPGEKAGINAADPAVHDKEQKMTKVVGADAATGERAVVVEQLHAALTYLAPLGAVQAGAVCRHAGKLIMRFETRVSGSADGVAPDRVDPAPRARYAMHMP